MPQLHAIDCIVLLAYLLGVLGISAWFIRRSNSAGAYMAADRSLPGWAVGMSIFGSYISSISFLANPGKSYAGNWNAFAFNLTTPIAAMIAVWFFVPFYRRLGSVSAYEHLEHRFGPWARTYAVVCFLLTQMARMGTIMYLLALAIEPLTGIKIPIIITVVGGLMIAVALMGGIQAVVWTGVAQSVVLTLGLVVCLVTIMATLPQGPWRSIADAASQDKFSLGSLGPSLAAPTFWVVFLYGLTSNLQNFGIDQSYVQRYITARSDRDAARSVWMGAWLYLPIGAGFFLIGTMLAALYASQPQALPAGTVSDKVFPHFIATQLPAGLKGLVIAALLAAASDSNLNNMATLTLCDVYRRYLRPRIGPRESMWVLRLATVVWGVLGIAVAVAMMRVGSVLDAWWELAGIFSGGMLGLFLLGMISRRAGNLAAISGVAAGVAVILWMTISPTQRWPQSLEALRSPFHGFMVIVLGTATILVVGLIVGWIGHRRCERGVEVLIESGESKPEVFCE